jgi:glycosyltransferase involved in cell wall biosynthesis
MNIGVLVDPYGEKSPGGLGRAIFEMAKALIAADPADTFVVCVKNTPKAPPGLAGTNWTLNVLGGKSLFLNGSRNMDKTLDLYIFFNPIIPFFFFPKKSIVVAHDFAYLELPERSLKQKINALMLFYAHALSLWKASKIVAVSEAAKQSTISHFGVKPDKIEVIYNGFVATDVSLEPLNTPLKFFLFAGVLKERKNVLGVIEAFAFFSKNHEGYELVIAGKKEGSYYAKCEAMVQSLGIGQQVRFLGYVTDGQLGYLYTKATALVFPSLIEGFGMPVLEAMSVGLPVITSNNGALAEVAGDAALLVNPKDPQDIARGMSEVANSDALKIDLAHKGSHRAKEFSWEKNAQKFKKEIVKL